MSFDDVLHEIIECLNAQYDGVIGWDQVHWWPKDAIEIFRNAGWIDTAAAADNAECPECQKNVFAPVIPRLSPDGQSVKAYAVACHVHGFVNIPARQLQQWRISEVRIAEWLAMSLKLKGKIEKDGVTNDFNLGTLQSKERQAELFLSVSNPISLKASGHSLPLRQIVSVESGSLHVDRDSVLAMVNMAPVRMPKVDAASKHQNNSRKKDSLEVGTRDWRRQNARNAANAKHDRAGGSREKQQRIREMWATGKYSTRDLCAEEECRALGMSYSAARRALRNTPDRK